MNLKLLILFSEKSPGIDFRILSYLDILRSTEYFVHTDLRRILAHTQFFLTDPFLLCTPQYKYKNILYIYQYRY